ncbi:hypothetical protein HDU76_008695 [Blyttiomyces sp. JEL0837]|nr:hypothetical protein HDU76_008695 [Blyttiomyces sp. JEL0837]
MALPQTALLAVRGPSPIPFFDEGSGWYPSFDPQSGDLLDENNLSPLTKKGLLKTRKSLENFLSEVVFQSLESSSHQKENDPLLGWPPSQVFILGFAQGGSMALELALRGDLERKMGGVVSIGGGWLPHLQSTEEVGRLNKGVKVLVIMGNRDPKVPLIVAEKKWKTLRSAMEDCNNDLRLAIIDKKENGMPTSVHEMRPIMSFFGENLAFRNMKLENTPGIYRVA